MSNTFEFNYSNGTGCYSTSSATFWNPGDFNQFDGDDFNFGGVGKPLKCVLCCPGCFKQNHLYISPSNGTWCNCTSSATFWNPNHIDQFKCNFNPLRCSGLKPVKTFPFSPVCTTLNNLCNCHFSIYDYLYNNTNLSSNNVIINLNPVVDTNTISPEDFRTLRHFSIILETSEHKYVLNPALNLLKSFSPEQLIAASLDPEDDFLYAYLNVAKCFRLDSKNELVYEGDGRLRILQSHLSKIDNPKYANKAQKLVEALWGKELDIVEITEIEKNGRRSDLIILRAHTTSAKCPYCGKKSYAKSTESGSHTRVAEDIPTTIGRPLYIQIGNVRKYLCQNPECEHYGHLFDEQLGFLTPYAQRTNRLNALILSSSIDGSFHGTQSALKLFGIEVGDDCIRKMIMNIKFPDDKNIEAIGVDDVAARKGQSYYTVIYALEGHRLLAILEGRDGTELEKWLDNHPNVKLICRDRSSEYAKHIDAWAKKHNVKVEQVADRFHLVQNCIEHLTENKDHNLPAYFAFERKTGKLLDYVPGKTAKPAAGMSDMAFISSMEYDNSPPVNESGQAILFSVSLREEESRSEAGTEGNGNEQTSDAKAGNTCKEQKYKIACAIRNQFDPDQPKKPQYKKLAEEFDIKPSTVERYIRMSQEEVEGLRVTKPRKETTKEIDNYKYTIFKMLNDRVSLVDVLCFVKIKGYKNSITNLAKYIIEIFKIVFPEEPVPSLSTMIETTYPDDVVVYTRGQIVKHLLTVNPKTKKDQFLDGKEDEILKKYPYAKNIVNEFNDFYKVIMGDDVNALVELCNRTDHIKELEGFYKHILDVDLEAVSNAIRYTWSSGFVEGNNNRFKLIKRIGYGRMKLKTLRQKCLLAFWSTLEGFELGGLIQWIPLSNEIDQDKEFWKAMAC